MARIKETLWEALEEADFEYVRLLQDHHDPHGRTTAEEVRAARRVRTTARRAVTKAARA